MSEYERFKRSGRQEIEEQGTDLELARLTRGWMDRANAKKYSYHFDWLGRPIIQYPQDMVAMQELVWLVRPDLIIETGIAHGGSLIMNASLLAMLDYCDAVAEGRPLDPKAPGRRVLGIDIDIRAHNRAAIESHAMSHRIDMIEGSSVSPDVIERVHTIAKGADRVLVCLDSNHTHEHVLQELVAYAPLTSIGSYCVVYDTVIEYMPADMFGDRPWGIGNSPKTALAEYLSRLESNEDLAADGGRLRFEVDRTFDRKLLITVAPGGYLQRV